MRPRHPTVRGRITRAVAAAVALALGLAGCQLTDPSATVDPDGAAVTEAADVEVLGRPEDDWPRTIAELRTIARPEAQSWQDDPVLADLTVWLAGEGAADAVAWARVRLTYVAADAERMLTYRATPDDLRVERPLLSGLELMPLPAAAVEAMEPFPDDALEPRDLAAASARALADCGADAAEVGAVLYATGAPAAWDGTEWTRTPTWRATVVAPDAGVVVDPSTGQAFAPLTCVDPLLLDAS
ncbi:hypothetical protein [Euzebya sp.]|uniref:hypothetical protein n=1 Tax=Euzebya sp. TaxID=1971409 RepID=UPI0035175432